MLIDMIFSRKSVLFIKFIIKLLWLVLLCQHFMIISNYEFDFVLDKKANSHICWGEGGKKMSQEIHRDLDICHDHAFILFKIPMLFIPFILI